MMFLGEIGRLRKLEIRRFWTFANLSVNNKKGINDRPNPDLV